MKPLTIEIIGTGTHNRGAELMAIAVSERMRSSFPGVRIAVSPEFGTPCDRRKYGFLDTTEFSGRRLGRLKTIVLSLLWRWRRGAVRSSDVSVVLDASGFAFSDQWGTARVDQIVQLMSRRHRRHQTYIMLPQALGPFKKPGVAQKSRTLFQRAQLVCARDRQSHAAVKELIDLPGLRLYPDFTVGVSPVLPVNLTLPERFVAIVPNYRMLDKGEGEAYLQFLRHALLAMQELGLRPAFVLHDAEEDKRVIDLVANSHSGEIPVLTDPDPRVLKGILSKADFVIGSRFHALVSSLSQGVPCIGAGWSHKYPELFADFACPDLLLSDLSDLAALRSKIQLLSDERTRRSIAGNIGEAAARIKERTNAMWGEVEALIRARI